MTIYNKSNKSENDKLLKMTIHFDKVVLAPFEHMFYNINRAYVQRRDPNDSPKTNQPL